MGTHNATRPSSQQADSDVQHFYVGRSPGQEHIDRHHQGRDDRYHRGAGGYPPHTAGFPARAFLISGGLPF